MSDPVNHPAHYTEHPSGIECIQITEHMGFNLGNAVKYIWRADLKGSAIEDLEKARWYIDRELTKRDALFPATEPAEEETKAEGDAQCLVCGHPDNHQPITVQHAAGGGRFEVPRPKSSPVVPAPTEAEAGHA